MSNYSLRSLAAKLPPVIMSTLLLFTSLVFGQVAPPETHGDYGVGLNWFAATADDTTSLDTAVWYPIPEGTEGDTLAYSQQGLPYESPFLGVVKDAEPIRDVQFPLVVFSHGYTGLPKLFAYLGESLASHGYVVAAPHHPRSTEKLWSETGSIDRRAAEVTLAVESMFARATTENDLLQGVIDTEKLIVGGASLGVLSTMASVGQNEYEPEGILLIDGLLGSPVEVDVPVMFLGGASAFASQAATEFVTDDFYGVDLYGADRDSKIHHWSFVVNGCQFRHKIVEAGATEAEARRATDEIPGFESFEWFGCSPELVEPGVLQQRVSEYAVAFASEVFDLEDTFLGSVAQTELSTGDLRLSVNVDTDSRREGLSVLLTDPQDRMYGIDPETGELINDFGVRDVLGRPSRIRPEIEFGISEGELVSGDFILSATADMLSKTANYEVVLQSEVKSGDDRVVLKRVLASGVVQPDAAIEPVTITLRVPPDGDCSLNGVLDVADLNCARRDARQDLFSTLQIVPGDLDGNGKVSFGDFLILSSNFGERGNYTEGNIDFQGGITLDDFLILAGNFDNSPRNIATVPEPDTGLMVAIATLILAIGRSLAVLNQSASRAVNVFSVNHSLTPTSLVRDNPRSSACLKTTEQEGAP